MIYPFTEENLSGAGYQSPTYFIYQIIQKGKESLGLIAKISLTAVEKGSLLYHESIDSKHSEELLQQFLEEEVQKKPVLLMHDQILLDALLHQAILDATLFTDYVTEHTI